jgi:hypothetical protein
MSAPTAPIPRELAHRSTSDLDVWLMWHPDDDRLTVEVLDRADGSVLTVPVGRAPAMRVFHHPFAHADAGLDRVAA